jgi:hypothetical protein
MKVLSTQTNLGSATNVSNASVVRLFNGGNDNILVTQKDFGGTTEGTFIVPSGDVVYVEKNYTDTLEGSGDVLATKTAYSSMMKFVSAAGSSSPTYTYSVSPTNVDEGGNFTTTITTTNVDDNTTLYWSLSGTNVTSADFSSGALTGSVTISNNSASFSHTVASDTLTEGTEYVAVKLFTDSNRTEQVGNTVTVNLADTSTTPVNIGNSVYFDGSGFLSVPASNGFSFGLGDFTVEAFIYREQALFLYDHLTALGNFTIFSYANGDIRVWNNQMLVSNVNPGNNTWFHLAVTRQAGTLKFYIDGVKSSTEQDWSSYNIGASGGTMPAGVNIGKSGYGEYGKFYCSNLRVIKGTAIYTSNFTPPTSALTNISGTVLLCCQSSTSTTAATVSPGSITTNGNPTAQTFGPFT